MPKLFDLDDYIECMSQRNGAYCLGSFELTTTKYSDNYERMKEYSKGSFNYNHTRLHRGFCMSRRCTHLNDSEVEARFAKCVDLYTRETYGFSSHIFEINYCRSRAPERKIDNENWFYFLCKCIVFLNILGTIYDIIIREDKKNPYIMCWSLRSNWKLLVDNKAYGEYNKLQPLQFARVLGSALVILGHVLLTITRTYMNNPRYFEIASQLPISMLIHNGTTIVQGFTLITCFLLTYKILYESDISNKKFGLYMLPSLLVKRIIRILPSYYLAVAFAATWWSKLASGPIWPVLVESESSACKKHWLLQISLLFNLVDIKERCLPQTWTLATDLQLYAVSATLALLLARRKYALGILSGLFIASIILIFGISYAFNFKSMLMVTGPEKTRTLFKDEGSITFLYISPWASAPSCILGMLLAHMVYIIQKRKRVQHKKDDKIVVINEKQHFDIKFVVFRSLCFLMVAWIFAGNYVKDHASSLVISAYTALERPVFVLLLGGVIYGALTKIDHFWYNIGSWNGWRVPGRLNLWVLLLHWIITVSYYASEMQLTNVSLGNMITDFIIVTLSSYVIALPLTLLIEMPAQRFLLKILFK